MNKDQLKGSWSKLKGKAKVVWAEVTDDGFMRKKGAKDKRYGVLQRKLGDAKQQLKRRIDGVKLP